LIDNPEAFQKLFEAGDSLSPRDIARQLMGGQENLDVDPFEAKKFEDIIQNSIGDLPFHEWLRRQLFASATQTLMKGVAKDVDEAIEVNKRASLDSGLTDGDEEDTGFKIAEEPDYDSDAMARMALYVLWNENPNLKEQLMDPSFRFEDELKKATEIVKKSATNFMNADFDGESKNKDSLYSLEQSEDDFIPDTIISDEFFHYGSLSSEELGPMKDVMFKRLESQVKIIEGSIVQLEGKEAKSALGKLAILKRVLDHENHKNGEEDGGILTTGRLLQEAHNIRQELMKKEKLDELSPSDPFHQLVGPRKDIFGNEISDDLFNSLNDKEYEALVAQARMEGLEGFGDPSNSSSLGGSSNGQSSDVISKVRESRSFPSIAEENKKARDLFEEEGDPLMNSYDDKKDNEWMYDPVLLSESGVNLQDERGTTWAVTIMDNRVTQKVIKGGYKMSHKVMVIVGNARGVAGWGIGKGPGVLYLFICLNFNYR